MTANWPRWRSPFLLVAFALSAFLGLLSPPAVGAQIRGEAALGQPFGIARLEIQLDPAAQPGPLGLGGLGVSDPAGRVLYPAVVYREVPPVVKELIQQVPLRGGPIRNLAGGLVRDLILQPPQKAEIFFLFTGDQPLDLSVQAREPLGVRLMPQSDPLLLERLTRQWWENYHAKPGGLGRQGDYPPLVENYLQAMLSARLGLPLPEPKVATLQEQIQRQLGMAMDTESARMAYERQRLLRPAAPQAADQPLPEPFAVPPLELPEIPQDVAMEPLAKRVPAECFYVRFGSFSHFLWFQDLLATWGGDLQNLVALRGLDYQTRQHFENQLVVRSSVLAKLLGDTVVADVAIIGTDLYLQEGGSYGLLFQARANPILASDFQQQRAERLKKKDGVTEEKVTIGDREVSYLSTPDGSVRSYYVADGNFHLITTSKAIVQRFLETGSGQGALGTSDEFRYARSVLPTSRDDTVFVYLSDAFFRNMVSPHHQVELGRRIEAMGDIELAQVARLAAAAERKPGDSLEALAQGGFLPTTFGPRADGSQTVLNDGVAADSLRGHRDRFVPIADVPVTSVTAAEAETYRQFGQFYQEHWRRLDPITIGIKRQDLPNRLEEITIDARMTPVAKENYERLQQQVGPADKTQLAPVAGNRFALEWVRPTSRIFAGVRDFGMPFDLANGGWLPETRLRDAIVGYLGSTGPIEWLTFFDHRMSQPDLNGMSSTPGGLWRRMAGPFLLYSFQPRLLMEVGPQLRYEPAQEPAQIRVAVADLTAAGVPPLLNKFGYFRTRETALGNLRLLLQMNQQLHIAGPECQKTAETLVDAKLICPFGGQYVYRTTSGGAGFWTSTFLEEKASDPATVPAGFVTPPLNWFRGTRIDADVEPSGLAVHANVKMQLPQTTNGK